ncbi:MAG TPA: phage virion morphogenesis protein [Gemmatimonadales bacterium]|nr:phage virion morphogenesis protein [Gemmatimonadales bacterium]
MSRPGAQIRVTGADQIVREIGSWISRCADMTPALKRIGLYGVEVSKQAFDAESDPETYAAWKPLSPKYKAWKESYNRRKADRRRRGLRGVVGTKILVFHGDLKRSIHHLITGKRSVAIGTGVPYGKYHQYGRGVPERRFLGLHPDDQTEIRDIVSRWIVEGKR